MPIAALKGDLEKVKELVEHGALVDGTTSWDQDTPLNYAILGGNKEVIRYLIQRKAQPNQLNKREQNSLHYAIEQLWHIGKGNFFAVEELISETDVDLNHKDMWGRTPLDQAKLNAMNDRLNPKNRRNYYTICGILQARNAKSSISLAPMPSEAGMQIEFEDSWKRWNNRYK